MLQHWCCVTMLVSCYNTGVVLQCCVLLQHWCCVTMLVSCYNTGVVLQCWCLVTTLVLCYNAGVLLQHWCCVTIRMLCSDTKSPVVLEAHQIKLTYFNAAILPGVCRRLISHYFPLTADDLQKWDSDPEDFGEWIRGDLSCVVDPGICFVL